jgi:hypothetical protein
LAVDEALQSGDFRQSDLQFAFGLCLDVVKVPLLFRSCEDALAMI